MANAAPIAPMPRAVPQNPTSAAMARTDTAIKSEEEALRVEAMAMNMLDVHKSEHKGRKAWTAHDMRLKEIITRAAMQMEGNRVLGEAQIHVEGAQASDSVIAAQTAFRPQAVQTESEQSQ